MNVRIFEAHAMKCMCAQTRPWFILSSKRVWGEMEFEPMLTPREKSPLPENFPRGGSNPRRCGQRAQTLPTSYSGPYTDSKSSITARKADQSAEAKSTMNQPEHKTSFGHDVVIRFISVVNTVRTDFVVYSSSLAPSRHFFEQISTVFQ